MSGENCINPKIGSLMHAYELGILTDEDAERFEMHILKCSHCFNEVKDFEPESELLASADSVLGEIISSADTGIEIASRPSALKQIWNHIWPDKPFIFRPAVAFVLILLLMYPAYKGIMPAGKLEVKPVFAISLFPMRSIEPISAKIEEGRDIILSFVYQGAIPGKKYIVELIDRSGNVVIRSDSFADFDEFEMGQLLIPHGYLDPGIYKLKISDAEDPASDDAQSYTFELVR